MRRGGGKVRKGKKNRGGGDPRRNTTHIREGVLTLGGGGGLIVEAAISRPLQLLLLLEVKVQQMQPIPVGRGSVTHAMFQQGCIEDIKIFKIGADTDVHVDKPHSQDPPKLYVSHMTERWGGATY